ncbi:MAG: hypothetical protein KAI55_03060 [Candidatus Aenigmarchaeota archaeon]|nr:hypothetical protein [Candidatus Aenigmarchaeota archaeon]
MDIVEYLRKLSVGNLYNMNTFSKCFPIWKPEIEKIVTSSPSHTSLINIGDKLKQIFNLTKGSGRSQSEVSGGGSSWEGLVCWYMNLCLAGSRTVVIKHAKNLIPECVSDAITVNYGSFVSNTESDLIAITFPNEEKFTKDITELFEGDNFNFKEELNNLCVDNFEKLQVGIIQCKTNWNDNAQIPMLWEIVYSSSGFENRNITIGRNGFTMKDFNKFSYSFVTVPTNSGEYKATNVSVKRVYNLSGGNYWGQSSKSGVASSVKEIFNRNFSTGWILGSQRNDINKALENKENLSYFNLSL